MNKSVAVGVVLFVAGLVVGRLSVLMNQPQTGAPAPTAVAPVAAPPPPQAGEAQVLRGTVAEVIQVSQYTYVRLETGEWAAVPSAPSLAAGQSVGISLQNEMTDFTSPSLGRTFARIWFGALEGAAPVARAAEAPPQAAIAAPEVKAALQAVGSSNALTLRVVDVYSERKALAGQRVKVKGKVDRVNFVQGIHYVHLKDGTGAAADKTDDLLCMSSTEFTKGAEVTLEGLIVLDKDVGMGPVSVVLDQAH
jgi:DNA-binding XRE family transcriptional regulator